MSATPTLWQTLGAREQRVVIGGACVALALLLGKALVLPYARAWNEREALIDQRRRQVASLEALVRDGPTLRAAAMDAERALAGAPQRVLTAPTTALAATGAQSLLQEYADRSRVTVTRLDVAAGMDSSAADGTVRRLPITMIGTTDIYGVAELLGQLARGPRAVSVEQLTVQANPALRGAPDVLQVTLALSAPWVVTP
jgi:hypothetical protein